MALETTIEQANGRVPITIIALDGELDASNFNDLIETARELEVLEHRTDQHAAREQGYPEPEKTLVNEPAGSTRAE